MVVLGWNPSPDAATYRVQLSTMPGFEQPFFDDSTITNTSVVIQGLGYSTAYYWRVNAKNDGGTSAFSDPWSFTTASEPSPVPGIPVLLEPQSGSGEIPLSPVLRWTSCQWTILYRLQLSRDSLFSVIVLDDTLVTDTSRSVGPLDPLTRYYWRVSARNTTGCGGFQAPGVFTTLNPTGITRLNGALPEKFELSQNYPNPFNPATTIRIGIPKDGPTILKVYAINGKEIATLLDGVYTAGVYDIVFDGTGISSGVYFIVCRYDGQNVVRRMVLLK